MLIGVFFEGLISFIIFVWVDLSLVVIKLNISAENTLFIYVFI